MVHHVCVLIVEALIRVMELYVGKQYFFYGQSLQNFDRSQNCSSTVQLDLEEFLPDKTQGIFLETSA